MSNNIFNTKSVGGGESEMRKRIQGPAMKLATLSFNELKKNDKGNHYFEVVLTDEDGATCVDRKYMSAKAVEYTANTFTYMIRKGNFDGEAWDNKFDEINSMDSFDDQVQACYDEIVRNFEGHKAYFIFGVRKYWSTKGVEPEQKTLTTWFNPMKKGEAMGKWYREVADYEEIKEYWESVLQSGQSSFLVQEDEKPVTTMRPVTPINPSPSAGSDDW